MAQYQPKATRTNKKFVPIPQSNFPTGYVSTLSDSRIPLTGLARMQNAWLEQDSIPRPRPPFIPYGAAFIGTPIGIGTFNKFVNGLPQYWEISMQSDGNQGKVYIRKDGGTWTLVGGSYDPSAWVNFCQAAAINTSGAEDLRVYISNGVNNLSYYDITNNTIVTYTALTQPSAPTLTQTGLSGSNFTQYYIITAYNAGGESMGSAEASITISTARDYWTSSSEYITLSWTAVSGATGYCVYTNDISGQEYYLTNVEGTTYKDDGSAQMNIYRPVPVQDSSAGPKVRYVVNIDNTLYACGDVNNPQYTWFSGSGLHLGDFSFNPLGGGYVQADFGGDTVPTTIFPFHSGQGTPMPTILNYGPAGRGKLYHVTTQNETVGSTTVSLVELIEGSSQDGTPAPYGVALYNNSAYYCTGNAFKTTGTKPSVINILATDTISNQIIPDIQRLNTAYLKNMVALEYMGRLFFAVPTNGSTTNNEIWILDLTRNGLWILSWPLKNVQFMWNYQDNNGTYHLLTLQNGVVLELDLDRTATPHQDNGIAFTSIVGSGGLIFDKGGVEMFSSYITYFKFLNPSGIINANIYTISEDNPIETIGASDTINLTSISSRVMWDSMIYSNPNAGPTSNQQPLSYSSNVGKLTSVQQNIEVISIDVDDIVNQQSWSVVCDTIGSDYLLGSVTTTGYSIPMLYYGQ